MKLIISSSFKKAFKKFTKSNILLKKKIEESLNLLVENPYQNGLQTHKLSGKLYGLYACSCGYDCRIIFEFIEIENEVHIVLVDLGSHDEVY